MSMVWPCPLTAGAYASMGRAVRVPRPDCPSCSSPVVFWSGYWRHVRWRRRERKIFIPRVRCRGCGVSHALLPAFVLVRRLDAAESAGLVIGQVAAGACGVRRAAAAAGVPFTTARGWVRRFAGRAGELAVSFSALAAEDPGPGSCPCHRQGVGFLLNLSRLTGGGAGRRPMVLIGDNASGSPLRRYRFRRRRSGLSEVTDHYL